LTFGYGTFIINLYQAQKGGFSMAVMDEFKEEREALKRGTPKQKLAYFWYYYKWHVIISVMIIGIARKLYLPVRKPKGYSF